LVDDIRCRTERSIAAGIRVHTIFTFNEQREAFGWTAVRLLVVKIGEAKLTPVLKPSTVFPFAMAGRSEGVIRREA
jgi:hypothetical protein